MASSSAVYVQDAHKSYGNKGILKGLHMQVQRGHIYGLLGASGCGKTTLLSCVVGMKKLNSGEVWVLGGKPGAEGSGVPGPRVGYMPQEVALVGEFTVKDAVFYFGRILNMTDKAIEDRFYKLSELLELPPENRYIKNCSGGQQRRVSFAASMVHKPELLILDEPTVGVDPVLRERMWSYLVELTREENTAVIITTHYIEEARLSNVIGLMRDGRLLAQNSPTQLLNRFRTDSLEEVFLILSQKQEQGQVGSVALEGQNGGIQNSNTDINVISYDIDHGSTDVLTKRKKSKTRRVTTDVFSGKRCKALMDKNWKQFYRNINGLIFILTFPVLEMMAFLLAVGADVKDIKIGIVNDETKSVLCPDFTPNGTAIPYSFSSCHFNNLSCRFLTYLDGPMMTKVQFDTLDDGFRAVKHGETVGVIYMAENITKSFEERVNEGRRVDDEILKFTEFQVWLDMSNRQIGASIKYKLLSLFQDYAKDVMRDCNYDPKLIDFINLKTIHGAKEESYTIFMTPGIAMTIMFFMASLMTSHIIITDRFEGVWERSTIAGVTSLEITVTHFLLQAAVVIMHTIEIMLITFLIFKTQNDGSYWTLALLLYLQGIAGMGFGFWISVVCYNYTMANIISTGSFYFMILICGLLWPLEGMPLWLQWVSKCLPFTIAIESFRNVMVKGWTISHLQVLNGIGVELIWIVGMLVISTYLIRSKR